MEKYWFISKVECEKVRKRYGLESLEREAERICAEYDLEDMTEYDVAEVLSAEKEKAICAGCKGLPCKKAKETALLIPVINRALNGRGVKVEYVSCQYAPDPDAERKEFIKGKYGLKSIEAEIERISKQYGLTGVGLHDIEQIRDAEQENRTCGTCKGLPCPKACAPYSEKKNTVPRIEQAPGGGAAVIRYYCRFYTEYLRAERARQASERDKLRRANALKSARIPARYLGKTFDDYKADGNNKDALFYAKHSVELGCGAFLYGNCGTGKTFLAALIAQMWLAAGKSVIFIKVPALLDDLRATYNGEGNEQAIYEAMSRADLLILDDMGMEKPSRYTGTTLCKIIDDRYDNDAATIITSNNTLARIEYDLNHAYDGENLNGSRLVDRLKELCRPIQLKGGSRR